MAVFDMDAYTEALEKPTVKLGGVVYEGQLLSIAEWMPFEARFKALEKAEQSTEEFLKLATEFLYKVFPKSRLSWKKDIVPELLNHPALMELLTGFLALQAVAILPTKLRKTNGTLPQSKP